MRLCILFALLLTLQEVTAQKKKSFIKGDRSSTAYEQGKGYYDKDKYPEAIQYFEEALKINDKNEDAIYYLGVSYRLSDQYQKASDTFQQLEKVNPGYDTWFYYEWGIVYSELRKFDEAIQVLEKFDIKYPISPSHTVYHHKAKYKIRYAKEQKMLQEAKILMKNPVKLSDKINSKYNDYAPVVDPTGTKLYFTSRRMGGISKDDPGAEEGDEDVYFIEKINGIWSEPQLMPEPINTDRNEGIDFISADGQLIGFTSGREGGLGSSDIYISTLDGTQWSAQVNMGNVVNSKAWDSNSTISYDGNRIIFASRRENGYGGSDLYMIEKNIFGDWGPAMNLGGIVNTPQSDTSPFLSQDGKTLYFSSDGHPGYGSYDIFKTV